MSTVLNMKGQPVDDRAQEAEQHERAWNMLFKAFAILTHEASKPGFSDLGFMTTDNRTLSMRALVKHAEDQLAMIKQAAQ